MDEGKALIFFIEKDLHRIEIPSFLGKESSHIKNSLGIQIHQMLPLNEDLMLLAMPNAELALIDVNQKNSRPPQFLVFPYTSTLTQSS